MAISAQWFDASMTVIILTKDGVVSFVPDNPANPDRLALTQAGVGIAGYEPVLAGPNNAD